MLARGTVVEIEYFEEEWEVVRLLVVVERQKVRHFHCALEKRRNFELMQVIGPEAPVLLREEEEGGKQFAVP